MKLHPTAVEYYALEITVDQPDVAASEWQASFDGGTTWSTAVDVDGRSGWLLAGPEVASPGGAIVMPAGTTYPVVRLVDSPELVVRDAPAITVTR